MSDIANISVKDPSEGARRIVFPGPGRAELEDFELPPVHAGQVLVRSLGSLMSTGTEGIIFAQLFSADTHWADWVQFPFHPGYAVIGQIASKGADTEDLQIGDVVALREGHASHHVVDAATCVRVPAGLAVCDAAWFALGVIAFRGAYAAQYRTGDDVLIVGAGPIGQMSVRWARASGLAEIIVVDPLRSRLAAAQKGGATRVIARSVDMAFDEIRAVHGGESPRTIVDTTGNSRVFSALLRLAPSFGRVVLLGDTGRPEEQRLTGDVLTRGLHILGAHDGHELDGWTGERVARLFFDLVASGRFDTSGLITNVFAPADCQMAYELPQRDRASTMGILFDWTGAGCP